MSMWTQVKRAQRLKAEAAGTDVVSDYSTSSVAASASAAEGEEEGDDEDEDEDDDGDWVERVTPGGKKYLYNTVTSETKVPGEEEEEEEEEEDSDGE